MALGQVIQDGVLNWLKGQAFPSPPSVLHLGFHSDALAAIEAEVSANLGGRIAITGVDFGNTRWLNNIDGGTRELVNSRAFVTGLADAQVQVLSFGLWSAASSGFRYLRGTVDPGVTVLAGDPAVFLQGDLSLRIS